MPLRSLNLIALVTLELRKPLIDKNTMAIHPKDKDSFLDWFEGFDEKEYMVNALSGCIKIKRVHCVMEKKDRLFVYRNNKRAWTVKTICRYVMDWNTYN